MRRWVLRLVWAMALGTAMPTGAQAQNERNKTDVIKNPPRQVTVAADPCPYRAATSYNAIVVNRPIPNPSLNMPNYVLCCEISNMNPDTYVAPPCEWGGRCGCGSNGGCGAILGRHDFGCGNSCNKGCSNTCDRGCSNWQRPSCGCSNQCGFNSTRNCGNSCDRGYRFWERSSCGCSNQSGCNSGCNTGCGGNSGCKTGCGGCAVNVKPVSYVEQIGYWTRNKKVSPIDDCMSCPAGGPKPKHTLPTASGLGCTGCSSFHSEGTFIFGSCHQFFGEPTHKWLYGK